ncbi:MAG: hypothetical protein CVV07_06610 [Gammaproteobacteria bacterium HGW-Gammaproteobacteria-11]|nr:MAG: hypothetical protein CVV07_06610 [Gammaproteobacteria bacterium HGW-Gammaproteobacteria-11]
MKNLLAVSLLALLTGCASPGKSDHDIYTEALNAHASRLPAGENSVEFISVKIVSHGMLPDRLAIAADGGANAEKLQEALLQAKASGMSSFLIIGSGTDLDLAVIKGACDEQDLSGMTIYYAGNAARRNAVETEVRKAQAAFHFISAI